ncbi:MAG: hypothetical protein AAFP84_07335 [Actinomycetota bacterium]
METLILGRPGAERSELIELLTDAGMTVHACHEDAWGCAGLDDRCPLDARPLDAAIAVAPAGDALDPQGVACARRARLPVITVGGVDSDPILRLADAEVREVGPTIVELVRTVARDAMRHRVAIEEAAPDFLLAGERLEVDVRRIAGSLQIDIAGSFADDRIGQIADQVRAAARRFDPLAPSIDVSVTDRTD